MNPRTSFRGAALAVGGLLIMAGVALASGGTDDTALTSNSPAATPGGEVLSATLTPEPSPSATEGLEATESPEPSESPEAFDDDDLASPGASAAAEPSPSADDDDELVDNSGPGNAEDGHENNSGPGNAEDGHEDNSGPGTADDDDSSGPGGGH